VASVELPSMQVKFCKFTFSLLALCQNTSVNPYVFLNTNHALAAYEQILANHTSFIAILPLRKEPNMCPLKAKLDKKVRTAS